MQCKDLKGKLRVGPPQQMVQWLEAKAKVGAMEGDSQLLHPRASLVFILAGII